MDVDKQGEASKKSDGESQDLRIKEKRKVLSGQRERVQERMKSEREGRRKS